MITADTITDEQIEAFARGAGARGNLVQQGLAAVALGWGTASKYGSLKPAGLGRIRRCAARARCAEIINARGGVRT